MLIFQLALPNAEIVIDIADQATDEPHSHKHLYQLLIPLKGKVLSHFNTKHYELEYGISSLKNPEAVHWHEIVEESKSVILSWDRNEFTQWSERMGYTNTEIEFSEKQYINPDIFIKQMNKWARDSISLSTPLALMDIQSELFEMVTNLSRGSQLGHTKTERSLVIFDDFVKDVTEYIHEHYTDKITLKDLMSISNQSKYHFIRSFKKSTGYSPYNYILNVRISKAKILLANPRISLNEISETLGFSTPNHFSRTFFNITGLTPKAYRQQLI